MRNAKIRTIVQFLLDFANDCPYNEITPRSQGPGSLQNEMLEDGKMAIKNYDSAAETLIKLSGGEGNFVSVETVPPESGFNTKICRKWTRRQLNRWKES